MENVEDMNDFQACMLQYIDEDEKAEREAIMAEAAESVITHNEADSFQTQLEIARSILVKSGRYIGLCEMCKGTNFVLVTDEDGYEGIQYKIDNEIPVRIPCFHGRRRTEEFGF